MNDISQCFTVYCDMFYWEYPLHQRVDNENRQGVCMRHVNCPWLLSHHSTGSHYLCFEDHTNSEMVQMNETREASTLCPLM